MKKSYFFEKKMSKKGDFLEKNCFALEQNLERKKKILKKAISLKKRNLKKGLFFGKKCFALEQNLERKKP